MRDLAREVFFGSPGRFLYKLIKVAILQFVAADNTYCIIQLFEISEDNL